MDILIINMDAAKDRLAFQTRQFDQLGLPFHRLCATTINALPKGISEDYWSHWERPMLAAERACFLSHSRAWHAVVEKDQPILILEDDVLLSEHLPEILTVLEKETTIDHLSLEVRGRRKLLSRTARPLSAHASLHRMYQDRSGAAAYVLWPQGAAKLCAATQHKASIADAQICSTYTLNSFQISPAAAVQADMGHLYGLTSPIPVKSSIAQGATFVSLDKGGLGHRCRRIRGQLGLGWRQIATRFVADRMSVPLNPGDFPDFASR